MNEPLALPPPDPEETPPPPQPVARRNLLPWLSGAGFLILAAALVWVWQHPVTQAPIQSDAQTQRLTSLEERVSRLEQRPAPQVPDITPLAARVAALEQRPAPIPAPAAKDAADLAPLAARVAALEQRPGAALGPLEARIAALEGKQPADAQLAQRIAALAARFDSLEAAQRATQADVAHRLDRDEARLAATDANAGQVAALADRMRRVAWIQAAALALDAGQKLGDIPGAPPALARFADAAPPTAAGLRLSFPKAARDALAAARPSSDGKPLLARVWAEAQDLVTVRQGDKVLVGDPTAGVLERARAALDAGDLPGTVAAVETLTDGPAQAMADWLAKARALLEARAALAEWAAQA